MESSDYGSFRVRGHEGGASNETLWSILLKNSSSHVNRVRGREMENPALRLAPGTRRAI